MVIRLQVTGERKITMDYNNLEDLKKTFNWTSLISLDELREAPESIRYFVRVLEGNDVIWSDVYTPLDVLKSHLAENAERVKMEIVTWEIGDGYRSIINREETDGTMYDYISNHGFEIDECCPEHELVELRYGDILVLCEERWHA